jgi:effector-binding domain-containing protein
MAYDIVLEQVPARQLAAVRGTSPSASDLGSAIIRLLDQVWPALRAQRTPTGHNVVVYYGGLASIAAGVEVFGPFEPRGSVEALSTPQGEIARTTHWGEYTAMRPAYAALEAWLVSEGRVSAGVTWEVYGDWAEAPQDRRTDIYVLLRPK